jgi:hypothetical protein
MDGHCNAGILNTNLIGELPGYGTVVTNLMGLPTSIPFHEFEKMNLLLYMTVLKMPSRL